MQISIEILARSKSTGFVKIQLLRHRNRARQINSIGIYNDRLTPEIPVKITRAIICKKARELRHNNLLVRAKVAILWSVLLCLGGLRTLRRRNLKGLCQLGGMRNRVPALTEQFEIVVPTFSNTVGEVRKPFPSA